MSSVRYDHRDGNDDYSQAGNLFRLFDAGHKQRLFENIAAAMQGVPEVIQYRQIGLFAKCDPAYGAGVAKALNLDPAGRNRTNHIGAADTCSNQTSQPFVVKRRLDSLSSLKLP